MEIIPVYCEYFRENFKAASIDSAPLLLKKIFSNLSGAIDFNFERN
jgi:hypothetical protein